MSNSTRPSARYSGSASHLLCPVTAVHICARLLLIARGSELLVISLSTLRLISSHKIFHGQAIQGITSGLRSTCEYDVLLWGGCRARFFKLSIHSQGSDFQGESHDVEQQPDVTWNKRGRDHCIEICSDAFELGDRILDVSVRPRCRYPKPTQCEVILLTAHNGIWLASQPILRSCGLVRQTPKLWHLSAEGRSLLFTAKLHWLSSDKFLTLGGTAFGELLVSLWQLGLDKISLQQYIDFRVDEAHDGAIFGLDVSYAFDDSLLIATCSDDRTIRLWQMDKPAFQHEYDKIPTSLAIASAIHRVGWTWAHASRIWRAQLVCKEKHDDPALRLPVLVSAGEDAGSFIWRLETSVNADKPFSREVHIPSHGQGARHDGKNIWALCASSSPSEQLQVITGGADGAIELCDLAMPASRIDAWKREGASISEKGLRSANLILAQPSSQPNRRERVKNFCWLGIDSVLVVTEQADIWNVNLAQAPDKGPNWTHVAQHHSLRQYCVLRSIANLQLALIAGSDGKLHVYDASLQQLREISRLSHKVLSLLVSNLCPSRSNTEMDRDLERRFYVLAAPLQAESAMFLQITVDVRRSVSCKELHSVPGAWSCPTPTSILVVDHGHAIELFVGDRSGYLHRFLANKASSLNGESASTLSFIGHDKIHHDAITSIIFLGSDAHDLASDRVMTTSRDGSYKITRFSQTGKQSYHAIVHETHLPFGPLVEGALVDGQSQHVTIWGFRGNEFIVYDDTAGRELASVNCKGGHRLWSYHHSANQDSENPLGCLAWNTNGELKTASLTKLRQTTILEGGHGREIKACAVQPCAGDGCSRQLIATGAEDTTIRLFSYQNNETNIDPFRCVQVIRRHNTGIQQLSWSQCGRYLLSCGGSEEFFVWRVRPVPVVGIGVCLKAKIDRLDAEAPDLRITSFDILEDVSSGLTLIAMVLSDSTVRVYQNEPSKENLTLLWRGPHTTCCLTQVILFKGRSCVDDRVDGEAQQYTVVATATDGCLVQWSPVIPATNVQLPDVSRSHVEAVGSPDAAMTVPTAPDWTKRIHQNAVRSMLAVKLSSELEARLIITAGDDNSLAFTLVAAAALTTLRIPRAHATSVTSLALVGGPSIARNDAGKRCSWLRVASSGNDMRVKLWDVTMSDSKEVPCGNTDLDVKKAGKMRTQIADVGCMSIMEGEAEGWKRLLIIGVGMEVMMVPASSHA